MKRVAALLALLASPLLAAPGPYPGITHKGDIIIVQKNLTVSTSGSAVKCYVGWSQVQLIVNTPSGVFTGSPTITYKLEEVDPGDQTTVLTGGQTTTGLAIAAAGQQILRLTGLTSPCIKVTWTFTGTSITHVYSTLTAQTSVTDTVYNGVSSGTISVACTDANINACGASSTVSISLAGQFGTIAKFQNATLTCVAKADFSGDEGVTWEPGLISDDRDNKAPFFTFTADSTTSVRGIFPAPSLSAITNARIRCISITNSTTVTLRTTLAQPPPNSYNALGRLRVSAPSGLFMDPFDGGTVDVTDRWTSSVSGAGAAITQTGGVLTIATTTTVSARANLVSKASFVNSGGDAIHLLGNIQLESGAALTNADRWIGWATLPGTPTYAAPVTDGIGFSLHDATLTAVVYTAGTKNIIATLIAPTDGLYHRYFIARRSDYYAWYIDNLDVPLATSSTTWPAQQTLPIVLAMANNTSGPSSGPTFKATNVSEFSDTPINMQISDGTFPWRQATVKPASTVAATTDTTVVTGDSTQDAEAASAAGKREGLIAGLGFNNTYFAPRYCDKIIAISTLGTTATVQQIALVASQKIYICGYLIKASTATAGINLKWVEGTGSNCVTGTTDVTPTIFTTPTAAPATANWTLGPWGNGAIPFMGTAGRALCINQSATTNSTTLSGVIFYTQN